MEHETQTGVTPPNTYKEIDTKLAWSMLCAEEPWKLIEKVLGVSRTTILSRLADDGYTYKPRPRGRPRVITDEMTSAVVSMSDKGNSDSAIARILGVSPTTVAGVLNVHRPMRHRTLERRCGTSTVVDVVARRQRGDSLRDIAIAVQVQPAQIRRVLNKYAPYLLPSAPRPGRKKGRSKDKTPKN